MPTPFADANTIVKLLTDWDGKTVQPLKALMASFSSVSAAYQSIEPCLFAPDTARAATWLLKACLEQQLKLDPEQCDRLWSQVNQLQDWQAKLHILQSFAWLTISVASKQPVEAFIRACFISTNKFVRAWTYHGFYHLAKQHPEFRAEVIQFFELGLQDEPPSVKARIRKLEKQNFQ